LPIIDWWSVVISSPGLLKNLTGSRCNRPISSQWNQTNIWHQLLSTKPECLGGGYGKVVILKG
jgi:hypothetical protein